MVVPFVENQLVGQPVAGQVHIRCLFFFLCFLVILAADWTTPKCLIVLQPAGSPSCGLGQAEVLANRPGKALASVEECLP